MATCGIWAVSWVISRLLREPESDVPTATDDGLSLPQLEPVRPLIPPVRDGTKSLPLPVLLDTSSSITADLGDEALRLAVESGAAELVSEVLTRPGTDIDRFFDRFSYRHTALFIATKLNRIELMRLLLDAGADPNLICTSTQIYERDTLDFHETALYHAVRTGKLEAARILLAYPTTDVNVICRHEYMRGEEEWGEDIESMTFRALDVVPIGPGGEGIAAELRSRGAVTTADAA